MDIIEYATFRYDTVEVENGLYLENTDNTDTDNMLSLTLTVILTLTIISHRIVTL